MKLLEYEAKQLLRQHTLPVPKSQLVTKSTLPGLKFPVVLKSQVPTGGRGKAGGIIIAATAEEAKKAARTIFSLPISGHLPRVLLAEEVISIKKEVYLALLVDRSTRTIRLIAKQSGGITVEDDATDAVLNVRIDTTSLSSAVDTLASFLQRPQQELTPFVANLFEAFIANDALLLEVNPLIISNENTLVCGDCKMELDDMAAFRHPEWSFEELIQDTNFVVLNPHGNIATIANGAGLAMATVDAVESYGMTPANFLDIGGGASKESVLKAFRNINDFPNVQAIVINIFAGITRCDEIAKAIIEARRGIANLPPLFIRLAGTNFEAAVELLTHESIPTLATLEECLDAAKEIIRE
jgi:succinyl-CoA synthetase beta subunit